MRRLTENTINIYRVYFIFSDTENKHNKMNIRKTNFKNHFLMSEYAFYNVKYALFDEIYNIYIIVVQNGQ